MDGLTKEMSETPLRTRTPQISWIGHDGGMWVSVSDYKAIRVERDAMIATLALYDDALTEAEAIFGGEYSDHFGPMFELAMAARDARAALAPAPE